jgi:hypothetical protein
MESGQERWAQDFLFGVIISKLPENKSSVLEFY